MMEEDNDQFLDEFEHNSEQSNPDTSTKEVPLKPTRRNSSIFDLSKSFAGLLRSNKNENEVVARDRLVQSADSCSSNEGAGDGPSKGRSRRKVKDSMRNTDVQPRNTASYLQRHESKFGDHFMFDLSFTTNPCYLGYEDDEVPQRGCQTARCSKAEEGEAHARIGRKRKKRKRRNSDPSGNDSLDDIPGAPDTTKEFAKLAKRLLHNLDMNAANLTLGLMLVATFHHNSLPYTSDFIIDDQFLAKGFRYMRFSSAAYGATLGLLQTRKNCEMFVAGSSSMLKVLPKTHKQAMMNHLNEMDEEDFVQYDWSLNGKIPGYFIAVDHRTDAVVLSLRGSTTLDDWMTDAVASYTPFLEGFAHKGMLYCSRVVYQKLKPVLLETFQKFPTYKLIVTGHSLGASIAVLFTILWRREFISSQAECYAYACPQVLSEDLCDECRDFVTSFVYNDDIVPRLSAGSMEVLKRTLHDFIDNTDNNRVRAVMLAKHKLGLKDGSSKKMAAFFKVSHDRAVESIRLDKDFADVPGLYPPGKVVHFYRCPHSNLQRGEWSTPLHFREIVISGTMFQDHLFTLYEKAFKELISPEVRIAKRFARKMKGRAKGRKIEHSVTASLNPLRSHYPDRDHLQQKLTQAKSSSSVRLVENRGVIQVIHEKKEQSICTPDKRSESLAEDEYDGPAVDTSENSNQPASSNLA